MYRDGHKPIAWSRSGQTIGANDLNILLIVVSIMSMIKRQTNNTYTFVFNFLSITLLYSVNHFQ